MPEPTLSEITNLRVDPELGTGTPAVAIDTSSVVHTLNQAAQFKAENDWRKYATFLNNIKETYRELGDISAIETATQDKEQLRTQMADAFKSIAENPRAFFSGGPKMAEIQSKITALRQNATESKLNRVFDMANREFLTRNPHLNTDQNKAKVESYLSQPLGKRKGYLLDLPGTFDVQKVSEGINKEIRQPFADVRLTDDNKSFITEKGATYDPQKYNQAASKIYDVMSDENGVPVRATFQKRFQELPDDIKKQYEAKNPDDPAKAYYMDVITPFNKQKEITDQKITADPYQLTDAKKKAQIAVELVKNKGRLDVVHAQAIAKTLTLDEQGDWLNDSAVGLIDDIQENGTDTDEFTDITGLPEGQKATQSEATMDMFTFDRSTKDILGNVRTEHVRPYMVTVAEDGTLTPIYTQKDKNGNDIQDENKKLMVDKSISQPVSGEQIKTKLVKGMQERGKILEKASKKLEEKTGEKTLTKKAYKDYKKAEDSKTTYEFKGKPITKQKLLDSGYTQDEIDQFIKQGLLKSK